MPTFDEEIAAWLARAAAAGELQKSPGYGQPLPDVEGWDETPAALRMPFKILKDAGVVPREVEMMRERARLAQELAACSDDAQRALLQQKLVEMEQAIALRLEALRINPRL